MISKNVYELGGLGCNGIIEVAAQTRREAAQKHLGSLALVIPSQIIPGLQTTYDVLNADYVKIGTLTVRETAKIA